MARKKSSFIADILDIGFRLPWWVTLLLASVLYLGLHHYAQIEIPTGAAVQDLSGPIVSSVIKTGASIGQYVIPLLLLGRMFGGLINRGVRKLSFARVTADKSGHKLDNLTWLQFERLVHQYFVERGFVVTETIEGADGGVDLRLRKEGRNSTVQCKHWRTRKVGVSVVREQFGIMMAEKADQCFIVTSGQFTKEAEAWAAGKAIGLIDGKQLRYLLGHVDYDQALFEELEPSPAINAAGCPRCGSKMVVRTAKRGPKAGSRFWGCTSFPKCRHTLDMN